MSTAAPYRSRRADTRPSRPRRILRRRRGARGPDAPHPAARRRRQSAGPRRRRDGELRRPPLRHPLRDELGGGAPPLPRRRLRPAPPRALPAVLRGGVERDPRGRAPRRAGRDRRGLPRPGHGRPDVHGRPGRRRGGADVGAGGDLTLVLPRRLDLEGRLQGGIRPPQAGRDHGRAAGEGGTASWRRFPFGRCRASAPRQSSGSRQPA